MACKKECFEATIASCSADLILKAGLTAATEYFWVIIDRHGNLTQRKVTTDLNGLLTIELPEGLNQYSGMLRLTIRTGDSYLTLVPLVFDTESYNCVLFNLVEIDQEDSDDSPVNQIGA